MKTISAFTAVLAVLLFVTPPAGAAAKTKTSSSYFEMGWTHYQRAFRQGAPETADRDEAQAAVAAYSMATTVDPKLSGLKDASRLYFSLALCREALGDYEAAMSAYKQALKAAPGKAVIAAHAARLRLKMNDSQQAVNDLQMALEKARATGQEDALLAALREEPAFAALRADDVTGRMIGAAPRAAATVAAVDVSGEEMRDSVSDAPRSAPKEDAGVLEKIAQADVEFQFHRYSAAASAYHDALRINQERLTLSATQIASVYEKIGASYNKLGQAEQAVHFLQKALQQNPADASAHYQIALAYAMSGDNLRAVHALKEAFASASGKTELRRLVMMAKTDLELEAVRDMPGFAAAVDGVAGRVALR